MALNRIKHNPRYLLKHLSVRVPWHDNKWNGCICTNPHANSACLVCKNCALNRNDESEERLSGQNINNLPEADYPACIREHGSFMAPFDIDVTVTHPYVESSPDTHGHLRPTNLRILPFSAAATPFLWMLKSDEGFDARVSQYDLNFDWNREPELPWRTSLKGGYWVQELRNQKAMLNCFFEQLEEESSLVFFYAKQVPFVETNDRIVVGVGRIQKIYDCKEYDGSNRRFGAAFWEHDIVHSIREDEKDGFLLPYHEALEYQKLHPDFDPASIAVSVPNDKKKEFSYGSEHVTNDSAIQVLLRCLNALEIADQLGIGKNHRIQKEWIHKEIARMQKLRGNYPGMGSVLCAFGISRGHFVAAEIISQTKESEDPWDVFASEICEDAGRISSDISSLIESTPKRLFKQLLGKANKARLNFLYLLSRFEISMEQATALWSNEERLKYGINRNDNDYLENPYLIYEDLRMTDIPVSIGTIDLGLYIKKQAVYPNNLIFNDRLSDVRIRALVIRQLEISSFGGNTLMPQSEIAQSIRHQEMVPACPVTTDYLELAEEIFEEEIVVTSISGGEKAYQLSRYAETKRIISEKVIKRQHGKRFVSDTNWRKLLDDYLNQFSSKVIDDTENRARSEKAAALEELFSSRISVLIGPAGTGKTTLLNILASHPDIQKNGVLLLAPTGKARVRMAELAQGLNVKALTLAQFLSSYNRYDGYYQRYILSNEANSYCDNKYSTVILDEASMLTEEMLATTLDCLRDAKRFILVGDHRQLPPIGAGRPFVDVIDHLKSVDIEGSFPRVSSNYAELTIKRRQGGNDREDILLSEWFSGEKLNPASDQIINDIFSNVNSKYVRFVNWKNESDFEAVFSNVLKEELGLKFIGDSEGFNTSLGAVSGKYFNSGDPVKKLEAWQVLSPVRDRTFGVNSINRYIHQLYKADTLNRSRLKSGTKLPKPLGSNEIVYGDKVINNVNQHRNDYYPEDGSGYVANGEIGVAMAFQTKYLRYRPDYNEIVFTTQPNTKYKYYPKEFSEENDSILDLAYALTVHKSQGSEFGKVFLVIPNPCMLLTREMLYTALTRQTEKVILLYQGDSFDLKELASPAKSDTVKRITNLFQEPDLVKSGNDYYSKNLIQQASDGTMLRSKSELLIYQTLLNKGLHPIYEKELIIDGVRKLPDFTIEDNDTGEIFYWEHLGMLSDPEYSRHWEEKKTWYFNHGILPYEEGGGSEGTLIVSSDDQFEGEDGCIRGGIQIPHIEKIIKQAFG